MIKPFEEYYNAIYKKSYLSAVFPAVYNITSDSAKFDQTSVCRVANWDFDFQTAPLSSPAGSGI